MANIKTPDGGFYVDSTEFNVDYVNNIVTLAVGAPAPGGGGLSLDGGTMNADAIINGTEELQITTADTGESGTVGITPQGVTLVHNTNSAADGRIRVIENSVEILAEDTTIQINGTGVNFNGAALFGVATIGGNSSSTAFENTMDMNNHSIINVVDPTNAQDVATKNYVDTKLATTSVAGMVKQMTSIEDSSGATDTALEAKVNEILAAMRTAGILSN